MDGLHTYRWGPARAPSLVLLHGLTDAGTAWPDAVRRWQGTYHVVSVDLRGHGVSPRFDDGQLRRSCEVWVSDVVDLLRSMDGPHILVGHSLGGLVALRAAEADGALVRGLVLEDPARPSGAWAPDPAFVAHQDSDMAPDERAVTNPLVRVRRLGGVGHCVRRDDPDAYHALVDPFLAGIS